MSETRTIEAAVHGRYLYEERGGAGVLVGFHGYAENAEIHMKELASIPGIDGWSLVAVQALHPFYNRKDEVVASWMTRLDREFAIVDNIAYVRRVVQALAAPKKLAFLGFSQGVAMAVRAAVHLRCDGLILLGSDLPPEITADPASRLPKSLLARGKSDEWYTDEKLKKDLSFVERSASQVTALTFEGGHEWTDEFRRAAGEFLRTLDVSV